MWKPVLAQLTPADSAAENRGEAGQFSTGLIWKLAGSKEALIESAGGNRSEADGRQFYFKLTPGLDLNEVTHSINRITYEQ